MSKKTITDISKDFIDTIEFEDIELLDCEEFRDLDTPLYPEIKEGYKISNKNRVYSTESKKFLSVKVKKHGNGYYCVSLQAEYENCPYSISKTYAMHRLMMAIFCPTENMENLMINHKDGNKENNDLDNLEWCTPSENTQHALLAGLYVPKKGEECSFSTVTEKIVKGVCKKWMSGKYTKKEIADLYGISETVVSDITVGCSWRHITKDYDFSKRPVYRKSKYFTPEDLHVICKYFQKNPINENESVHQYIIRAINESKYNVDMSEITENLIYAVRSIYERKRYKRISSLYIF